MLENCALQLNSSSDRNYQHILNASNRADVFSLPCDIKNLRQNVEMASLPKKLMTYGSTPNLMDAVDEGYYENLGNSLYKNKSTECLANAADYLENFLFNAYQKTTVTSSYGKVYRKRPISFSEHLKKLEDIHRFLTSENTKLIHLQRDSRGLGLSISGGKDAQKSDLFSQLIRISKLYPLQPAMLSGNVFVGDIILEVNGVNMVGLTHMQALDHLHSSGLDVSLKVFRPYGFPSFSMCKDFWPIALNSSFSSSDILGEKQEVNSYDYSEAYEITLVKENGSLGFSIYKNEANNNNELPEGFFVKSLVREPALSDGRIQPGDRILKVNDTCISSLSHADAIFLLRNASDVVTLTICSSSVPTSPLSLEDVPISKSLRWEAVELLNGRNKLKNGSESSSKKKFKRRIYHSAEEQNVAYCESIVSSLSSCEPVSKKDSLICNYDVDICAKSLPILNGQVLQENQQQDMLDSTEKEHVEKIKTFEVALQRRWHARLGFSICDPPLEEQEISKELPKATIVKAVHEGSLAAKDGRIQVKDRLLEVNSESLIGKPAVQVIDILRKKKGILTMVLCRLENSDENIF